MSSESRMSRVFFHTVVFVTVVGLCTLGVKMLSGPKPKGTSNEPLKPLTLKPVDLSKHSIRAEIRQALGVAPEIEMEQRIEILHSFDDVPTGPECEAMLFVALQPRKNTFSSVHSTYVHEIFTLVQRQTGVAEKFARVLATLALDSKRDGVIRDYSLQHLRNLWARKTTKIPLRRSIQVTFTRLATSDDTLAASALLSLHVLGDVNQTVTDGTHHKKTWIPGVSDEELRPLLERVFDSPGESESVGLRLAALRVVKERELKVFLPEIRKMASGQQTEQVLVRMSAVSTLANIGADEDRKILTAMKTEDPMVRAAINKSISKNL